MPARSKTKGRYIVLEEETGLHMSTLWLFIMADGLVVENEIVRSYTKLRTHHSKLDAQRNEDPFSGV